MTASIDWAQKGFAQAPVRAIGPKGGLLIYRAWGAASSEWGSGYFSLEKPQSVLDAELRFNIADWGNGIHFVSTFRVKEGVSYFVGPLAHGSRDLSKPGTQVFLESPFITAIERVGSFELLKHDVSVAPRAGHVGRLPPIGVFHQKGD